MEKTRCLRISCSVISILDDPALGSAKKLGAGANPFGPRERHRGTDLAKAAWRQEKT